TYQLSSIESIDTVSGNLSLKIPFTDLSPMPGGFKWNVGITYNSGTYDQVPDTCTDSHGNQVACRYLFPSQGKGTGGGWQYSYTYALNLEEVGNCSTPNDETYYPYRLSMIFPDGSHHILRLYGQADFEGTGFYSINPANGTDCHTGAQVASPLSYY